jgi:hypothetical protein
MDSDPEPLHPCTKTTLHKLYHHIVTTTTPAPPPDTRFPRSFRFQQINQSFTNLQTNLFSILPTSNSFLEELLQPETPLSPTAPPNDRNRPLTTPTPPFQPSNPLFGSCFAQKRICCCCCSSVAHPRRPTHCQRRSIFCFSVPKYNAPPQLQTDHSLDATENRTNTCRFNPTDRSICPRPISFSCMACLID